MALGNLQLFYDSIEVSLSVGSNQVESVGTRVHQCCTCLHANLYCVDHELEFGPSILCISIKNALNLLFELSKLTCVFFVYFSLLFVLCRVLFKFLLVVFHLSKSFTLIPHKLESTLPFNIFNIAAHSGVTPSGSKWVTFISSHAQPTESMST